MGSFLRIKFLEFGGGRKNLSFGHRGWGAWCAWVGAGWLIGILVRVSFLEAMIVNSSDGRKFS